MGTGIGEAMLISAAAGAATGGVGSALTGGDVLQGILTGGILGGATGGLGNMLGGQAAGASTLTADGFGKVAQAAAEAPGAGALINPTVSMAPVGDAASQAVAQAAMNPTPEVGLRQVFAPSGNPELAGMGFGERLGNYITQNPVAAGAMGSTIGGMMLNSGPTPIGDDDERYSGPLSRFSYSPSTYRPAFAAGGLAATPEAAAYFGGRQIEGAGDGLSDDVPAVINGEQPAALADGEFVIPADVVSGLGNGSTDAGARALYDMMARVRQARTGREEQAPAINPQAHLQFV